MTFITKVGANSVTFKNRPTMSQHSHQPLPIQPLQTTAKTSLLPATPTHHGRGGRAGGVEGFKGGGEAQEGMRWELHLCVRSAADIPFRRYLDPLGDRLVVHSKADGGRLDFAQLLAERQKHDGTTHVCCCGSARMMDAVAAGAKQQGFPDANMHFETFEAQVGGNPFEVELRRSGGRRVGVPAGESRLDVLREAGVDVPSSCEVGNCGTCRVEVVAGMVERRETTLGEGGRRGGICFVVFRGGWGGLCLIYRGDLGWDTLLWRWGACNLQVARKFACSLFARSG